MNVTLTFCKRFLLNVFQDSGNRNNLQSSFQCQLARGTIEGFEEGTAQYVRRPVTQSKAGVER